MKKLASSIPPGVVSGVRKALVKDSMDFVFRLGYNNVMLGASKRCFKRFFTLC